MKSRRKKVALSSFSAFLLLMLVFVLFFWANFHTVMIRGNSMEPTFYSGERLLVSDAYWLVGGIKKNDIVVMDIPEKHEVIIKRVYGLPGDEIDLNLLPKTLSILDGSYVVPEGKIYVIGDNMPASEDSRVLGALDMDHIIGKVIKVEFGLPANADSGD
ncbi:MAG: signal peptidase I [Fimbriimonadaceae bacterium]